MAPRTRARRRTARRLPQVRRYDVTRREFTRVIALLNQRGTILKDHDAVLNSVKRDLEIQFKRIAEIQYDLDEIRRAWNKTKT